MPRGTFQCPCPFGELTQASTGGLPTLAGSFGSVSYGITAPFLWVLVHAMFCFFSLQDWSLYFQYGYGIWVYRDCATPTVSLWLLFCLWNGISFLIVSKSVSGCSPASCYFDSLTGGDEHISFYSTILNQNPRNCISVWKMCCQMYYYIEHKEDILYRPNDIQK